MSLDKSKERVRPECEINRIAPSYKPSGIPMRHCAKRWQSNVSDGALREPPLRGQSKKSPPREAKGVPSTPLARNQVLEIDVMRRPAPNRNWLKVVNRSPALSLNLCLGRSQAAVCLPRPTRLEKKRMDASVPAHELIDKSCNNHRRIVGCVLSGARRVHPVIVGWSTGAYPNRHHQQ
jgi:hypothetical protein